MADFVFGHKEIERMLNQLPERAAKNVTVNSLKAGGRVLVKGMKQRAPKRTGKLAMSPVVSSAAKATKRQANVVVGFRTPTSRRVHLTEFGTEHSPAQPFIRPTLEQDGAKAIKAIGEILGKGIEREARKLVGK